MSDWLESRTGLRAALGSLLGRVHSARSWAPALGHVAGFLFLLQCATGVLLALYYRPAFDGAHASVERIVSEVRFGWLVRSIHVWGTHLLLATTLAHLAARFVTGSHRAPRELVWLSGVALLAALLGSAFTGQVLPLDQEGLQGALIAASEAGPAAEIVKGGPRLSDATVSRFFTAHVVIFPAIAALAIALHVALVAKHRLAGEEGAPPGSPHRATLATLGAAMALAILAFALPAGIGPKGDPSLSVGGVKPLWIFLPLYQAMKGGWTGTFLLIGLPAALVALPFVDRGRNRLPILLLGFALMAGLLVLGLLGAMDGTAAAAAASGR